MSDLSKTIEFNQRIMSNLLFQEKQINNSIKKIFNSLNAGKKILTCGNGGSAADAQHLAAEYVNRLNPNINRKPYPIMSLAMDSSHLTACGNDFSFDEIFSRSFEAFAKKGDVLLAISTSGLSKNIIEVLKIAKKKKKFIQ